MDARQIIIRIIGAFDHDPGHLDRILETAFSQGRIDRRDRRFIFEIVYGVIRRRLTLNYMIDQLLATKALKKNSHLRRILQVGLYQIIYMERVPDHAAVNESVKLAKADPATRDVAGVVNGVLRKVLADQRAPVLPSAKYDLIEHLSIKYSHPRWMVERWLKNFGLAQTKQLLVFNNTKPDIYLRRKIRNLSRQQFETEARSLCDPASGYLNLYYRLKNNRKRAS